MPVKRVFIVLLLLELICKLSAQSFLYKSEMDWNVISDSINYYVLNNSEDNLLKYSHQIINKAKEENSNESAKVLLEVSILLFNADKYNHAVRFGTEASSIYKSILGTNNMDYACTLSNLSIYYSMQGNYTQAIKLSKEALNICEKLKR